ncbi:hypothetical protein [Luteimonas fraxinea]|uniref:Uncharacterized protein n=1 Tax=Luteimonas fraxinea TaxID=2901869 RepID=A0ABS8UB28_9GAMM|nr:hypothetical protein [Luteimonas fraxinea]MCD9096688.1 hypothetical protein [Luteimonas fraxinea]MCD9126058.1 hypothetical protein [Luteimonas fraxinea]
MVEIRALEDGRFEVFADERHYEAFEGSLGAIAVAHALAADIALETHAPVTITSPWGDCSVSEARILT